MIFMQCLYKNVGFIFWLNTAIYIFDVKSITKNVMMLKGFMGLKLGPGWPSKSHEIA